jgi:AbrB family looped-hinge helix DNA binding protein
MLHSKLTSKGQTTIPGPVREALNLKPGNTIVYELEDGRATLRVHPGAASLAGILASKKGKGVPFRTIREAAKKAWVRHAAREGLGK